MVTVDISSEQLERYVSRLGAIGRNVAGGIDRPVYSDAWVMARDEVAEWMGELGLAVRSDAVGNLFGRVDGESSRVVLTGSHIDTVPNGGPLDGALGIHAALTAVGALIQAHGRPRQTLEVVAIGEEEGVRFPARFWGARAMNGLIAIDEADQIRDSNGVSIGAAMRRVGFDPARIPEARRADIAAFVELHIEQGALLEEAGQTVGIVRTITGQKRTFVTVRGRADHAGTTPMDRRRDALLGAAEMALAIEQLTLNVGRPAVATVGSVSLLPGVSNVVAGEARFTVDVRHSDPADLAQLIVAVEHTCDGIAARRGLVIEREIAMLEAPQPLDDDLQRLLERCADDLKLPWMPMISGAGHDSEVMARFIPTAMIFVPSHDGRSHSPAEFTPTDQMLPGVQLLAEALYRLAYVPTGKR
jgi:allantoate deiminase